MKPSLQKEAVKFVEAAQKYKKAVLEMQNVDAVHEMLDMLATSVIQMEEIGSQISVDEASIELLREEVRTLETGQRT